MKNNLKEIIKSEIVKASADLTGDGYNLDLDSLDEKINKLVGENITIFNSVGNLSNTIEALQKKLEDIQLKIEECSTQFKIDDNV